MATIRTAIELQDNFTSVLYQVINSVNLGLSAMEDLHQSMNAQVDTSSIEAARDSINQATLAVQQLDAAMQGLETPASEAPTAPTNSAPVDLPVEPEQPEPVQVPVHWQSDNMEVFTSTGVERFEQEVQSANNMLNTLNQTQSRIAAQAVQTDLFPDNAIADMNNMQNRLQAIQQRIQTIESNPLNMGSDTANAELEQLRGQLDQAVQEQEALNRAVENMDVEAANQAYLRLSQTVGNTERYIRDNVDEQRRFNRGIEEGTNEANSLMQTIKGAVATYATIQTLSTVLNLSDQLTSTTARLNLMNDGLQTTQDLQNMIYLSAERARGSYQATADAVSKLGLMAGDAFGSSKEIVAFMEQVNKQFTIAGTETAGIDAAMLQLTQAMGSGVLRGEEYNSILEQAPNIIQAIADYMEVPKGQLKDMAADGAITADIVKAAMFAAADETNKKFASMPKTFSQIWTSFQNTALMAFQPVLQRMNEIANSEAFQEFVNNAINVLSKVADIAISTFDTLTNIASVISDNWSWIEPIILGVVAAFVAYNTVALITNAILGIQATVAAAKAAADMMQAGSTFAAAAAQHGLNAALLACPITWIILLIIALIVVFLIFTEQIVGATYWLGALFTNIGLWIANVAIAIWNSIKNVGQWFVNLGGSIWAIIQNVGFGIINFFMALVEVVKTIVGNIGAAFNNAWVFVQQTFWTLVDGIMQGLKSVAEFANNTLGWLGVNIDTSSFDFAKEKAEELNEQYQEFGDVGAAWDKGMNTFEYKDVGASWEENPIDWSGGWSDGMNTFDTFQDGWGEEAYNAGAEVGAGIHDGIMNAFDLFSDNDSSNLPDNNFEKTLDDIYSNTDITANNTDSIADSMDITEEDLKYLRDIAEQEAVNRFTTAEITIEQTNHNTVSGKMDLDGIVSGLTDAANEAVDKIAEGVHE